MAEKIPNQAEDTKAVDPNLHHVNTDNVEVAGWVSTTVEARNATEHEHSLTWMKALKLYPKACFCKSLIEGTFLFNN